MISWGMEVGFSFQFQNYRLAFKTFWNCGWIQVLYVKPLDQCVVKLHAERFAPVLTSNVKGRQQQMSRSLTALVWKKRYKYLGFSTSCLASSGGRECFSTVWSWQSTIYFGWHYTQICSKEILCICTHLIGQQNGMHSEIPLKSYITYLLSEE